MTTVWNALNKTPVYSLSIKRNVYSSLESIITKRLVFESLEYPS
jgi:hypothetical protein